MRGAAIGPRRARGAGSGTLFKNLLHVGNKVRALAGIGQPRVVALAGLVPKTPFCPSSQPSPRRRATAPFVNTIRAQFPRHSSLELRHYENHGIGRLPEHGPHAE